VFATGAVKHLPPASKSITCGVFEKKITQERSCFFDLVNKPKAGENSGLPWQGLPGEPLAGKVGQN
jgi:hypothetical protein